MICDALEMKAASAAFGIPEAAVLAVIAGHRPALPRAGHRRGDVPRGALRAGRRGDVRAGSPRERLEEAAARVAGAAGAARRGPRRVGLAADGAVGAGDGIGLVAARRALRSSGPVPGPLADPLVVEVEPEENIAAGPVHLGLRAVGGRTARVDPAAAATARRRPHPRGGRGPVPGARRAGRPQACSRWSSELLAARPDTVLVEMGVPAWTPPPGTAYLATYGASRVCAQAAAEALGLG